MGKKRIMYIIFILVLAWFVLWTSAIVKCEMLTLQYKDEFENAWKEYTMIDAVDYCKVINYTETSAEVYYVSKFECGNLLFFSRVNNEAQWDCILWKTIWSSSGSASDIIWPYIR